MSKNKSSKSKGTRSWIKFGVPQPTDSLIRSLYTPGGSSVTSREFEQAKGLRVKSVIKEKRMTAHLFNQKKKNEITG